MVRKLDANSLEIANIDTRYIKAELSATTSKPEGLQVGDPVRVEATQDDKGYYHAASIRVDTAVAKQMPAQPVEWQPPQPQQAPEPDRPSTVLVNQGKLYDDDDAGPPTLKRGKPSSQPRLKQADPQTIASAREPEPDLAPPKPVRPTNPHEELIERAREAAGHFLQELPNFICQQMTTRYISETRIPDWHAQDVITADMVYDDGKEDYRNLQINGKRSNKPPEETGAWSTGEFGTMLDLLFHPASATDFKYVKDDTINGNAASIYDFKVDRLHSHWKIEMPSEYILPAYGGSVWVDKKTARVLRIELQGRDIPRDFPRGTVESAVDYDFVTLGGTERFLLPTHAESLSCYRGSYNCDRNVIDFRNYHKFTGESTIKFGDQQ